jgi:hypothetical protein
MGKHAEHLSPHLAHTPRAAAWQIWTSVPL